jgi:hypothetical protein
VQLDFSPVNNVPAGKRTGKEALDIVQEDIRRGLMNSNPGRNDREVEQNG